MIVEYSSGYDPLGNVNKKRWKNPLKDPPFYSWEDSRHFDWAMFHSKL